MAFLSRGASSGDEPEGSRGYVRLSEGEVAKLWKGLFYCTVRFTPVSSHADHMAGYWMSDKPLIQQTLASDLSELLLLVDPPETSERLEAALAFLEGFWTAMVREWTGIDRLRCVVLISHNLEG